eukprot:CAMPEP_0194082346 /NCGR_PEP_ID=MMETSP0149-20130528/7885_1 /TAXON_ID=122233 /ORGANISM="Chaetoceros debilis, Strain MM31A-1" /LENGTH=463 /DNA_ID=CAMNT_0038764483 /DNA_START=140 /DNA_END=1531 /DNA_ORIENTATION=+
MSVASTHQYANNSQHDTSINRHPAINKNIWLSRSLISKSLNSNTNNSRFFSTSKILNDEQNPSTNFRGYDLSDSECNVPPNIVSRLGRNLHLQPKHPLNTIKTIIEEYWQKRSGESKSITFATRDDLDPIVATHDNFDSLLIEPDHVSRSKSDTYYLNPQTVLRTHTSAHQTTLLKEGEDRFLVTGDVYRRDEIDASHYPIFHQMEGVRMFNDDDFASLMFTSNSDGDVKNLTEEEKFKIVENDLKNGLEGMVRELFGDVEMRWGEDYFPFTDPSFELEIYFNDEWLEVLGCGVVHQDIVKAVGRGNQPGWAFGLGLERLAMILFSIPDIRLFWSDDQRFHSQFESGEIVTFQPYSKYPPCFKDISFWTDNGDDNGESDSDVDKSMSAFHPNDFNEIVRDIAGDLVERVELIDEFVHPKTNRVSNCFRISYRSMDRSLTNEEIDALQERVRDVSVSKLGVELR